MINDISKERQTEIIEKALDWFSEHFDSEELYKILKDKLTMTDDEIDFYGFELSDFNLKAGASMVHLHEENDDCYLYLSKSVDLFRMAIAYQYDIKNKITDLKLESLASVFENASVTNHIAYSVVSRNLTEYDDVLNLYQFDFENDTLSVCNKNNCKWSSFHLCDIGEAIDEATFNDTLTIEDKHSIFIQQLIGKEIIETDEEESESPSMSM